MLECVLNVSEGRDGGAVDHLVRAAGDELLDLHTDADHHRSVLTLLGEQAPRRVTRAAVDRLDLRVHSGAHPRIGVVDVVPFVPLGATSSMIEAVAARDRYCAWAARDLGLPCFAYGPERTLPVVRSQAFASLDPTTGPRRPHPSAGAVAVGARDLLVAYNLWLAEPDLDEARRIARALRSPSVRALGLAMGDEVQVSMNLLDPNRVGPAEVWDRVAGQARIRRAELVGLVPAAVLTATPPERWSELDLDEGRTIEARVAARR